MRGWGAFWLAIVMGTSLVKGQAVDPDNPLLRIDRSKEVEVKMFNARSLEPKMAPYDRTRAPKEETRLSRSLPVKEATGLAGRQSGVLTSEKRWAEEKDGAEVKRSAWDGRKAELGRRAGLDARSNDAPREAKGWSDRVEEPKVYLGPENPQARSEAEIIRNTLGGIQSAEQMGEHRLTQAEIRRLLMTPERVRKAEAADKDPGITLDVAPRAVPVEKSR